MSAPAEITVRPAVPEDAERLTDLHLDCWDDAYTGLIDQRFLDERRTDVPSRVEKWRRILAENDNTLVAEGPDGLIGFVSSGPGRDNDVDTDTELWALYVRAGHWGEGVGYTLLETAIDDRAAYLWVLHGNERAIRFYERQGFRLDGTRDEHDEGLHVRMVRAGR